MSLLANLALLKVADAFLFVAEEPCNTPTPAKGAKLFIGMLATLNYYPQVCLGIQFPAREIARHMAKPVIGPWKKVERVASF